MEFTDEKQTTSTAISQCGLTGKPLICGGCGQRVDCKQRLLRLVELK
jgi:hypothetical protein